MFATDCLLEKALVYHTNKQYYNYRVRRGSIMRSNMRANNVYSRIWCLKKIWAHMLRGGYSLQVEEALVKWSDILFYSTKKIRSELSLLEEVRLHEMNMTPIEKCILLQAEKEVNPHWPHELYDFLKEINTENNYIIYGAGRWSRRLITFLDSQGLFPNISSVMVTTSAANPETLYGLPVVSVNEVEEFDSNTTVIVAVRGEEQEKIKEFLLEKGIEHIVCLKDEVVYNFSRC